LLLSLEKFSWLENSLKKQAAFCFNCRNFATSLPASLSGGKTSQAFTKDGFNNWAKALDSKAGFAAQVDSKKHQAAVDANKNCVQQKPNDVLLSAET